jgi:hypothetical protein
MKPTVTSVLGILLCSLAFGPHVAAAQEVREPVDKDHVISGNPLILLAGWFNAEYERKVMGNVTVGIAGGWLDLDEADYTSMSGFFRFYPQEAAFTGFYLGGRAGIHNVEEDDDSNTALGIGVDVGYAWLLGPGRSFYVGIGIGATRLFSGDLGDASSVVPSVRLVNVGIAF